MCCGYRPHGGWALLRRRRRDHLPVVVDPVAVGDVDALVAAEHVRAPVGVVVLVEAERLGDGHVLGLSEVRRTLRNPLATKTLASTATLPFTGSTISPHRAIAGIRSPVTSWTTGATVHRLETSKDAALTPSTSNAPSNAARLG